MTTPNGPATEFTYRGARSGGLLFGLVMALSIETAALHLLLHRTHPAPAWVLTLSSISVILWLTADFRAMGRGVITLRGGTLDLCVGLRLKVRIPLSNVAGAARVTWRELPTRSVGYLNAMKPVEPNIVLTLRDPSTVRLVGVVRRSVTTIGLQLDDPESFMAAMSRDAHY